MHLKENEIETVLELVKALKRNNIIFKLTMQCKNSPFILFIYIYIYIYL